MAMKQRSQPDRRCAYVIALERSGGAASDLAPLANYLSNLGVNGCEVIVVDGSPREQFDENRSVLRWVARHIAPRVQHRHPPGVDPVAAAIDFASQEKVIVADEAVRYTASDIDQLCDLLELHEVVVPQDYLDPLPWWGGIEAGRILVHRGIEPIGDGGTFGFRRSAVRGLRAIDLHVDEAEEPLRRLGARGAEVFSAHDVFIRREPPPLTDWIRERSRSADAELSMPVRSAFFFGLIPIALLLALIGGAGVAGGYASAIGLASLVLALRGRSGAGAFFPLRACLYAPVWVLERSISVYWALLRKLRLSTQDPGPEAQTENNRTDKSVCATR
jgi:hypothetical protein